MGRNPFLKLKSHTPAPLQGCPSGVVSSSLPLQEVGRDRIGVWTQGFTVAKQTLYHLNHTSSPSLFSVLSWLIEDICSDQSKWDSSFSSILLEPFLDYININSKSHITTPFPAYFLLRNIIHTHTYILYIFVLLPVSPTWIFVHFVYSLIMET
jgi:hypothetical protein